MDAPDIIVIAPYKADVEYGNRQLSKDPAPANMSPLQTVSSFHSREGKMAVDDEAAMCAASCRRQACHWYLGGQEGERREGYKYGRSRNADFWEDDQATHNKAPLLREILLRVHERGRFFEAKVCSGEEPEDKPEQVKA